ncbi:hypothetical protein [Campylobacter pinnipediorum]|uniref:Toxin-antitoxin system, antitoxin component n=1 Tax=Campylobacter pinnipediorum subsp. pinnipediorum TaxID=1660067 RepID=A0AAX0LB45_9BACT|nr:hypothetical protein [Campylobacter pinnipediorum]OPA77061.1 hypothetical protein BFG05_03850 [Campylobacter pinnipediorum subsp. pinnipediorum]OPA78853.1 hypothetical protein BFG04_02160 [Campylobacter pinnipediorum subsp. pinnipediorum]
MTITLTNVNQDFLNVIKSLLPLNRDVELYEEYEPNNETLKVIKDIKDGKNLSKSFKSVDDIMKALND